MFHDMIGDSYPHLERQKSDFAKTKTWKKSKRTLLFFPENEDQIKATNPKAKIKNIEKFIEPTNRPFQNR